jgi:hypothetical protein
MEVIRLLGGASFDPDDLKVIGQAFDMAWTDIAGNFGDAVKSRRFARSWQGPFSLLPATVAWTLRN